MKKVLYGVALTLLASVSVGSLQSCKDDVNDLATQTSYDLSKLRQQLKDESVRLEGLVNAEAEARRTDIATVNGLIEKLQQKDAEQQTLIDNIDGALSQLKGRVDQLEGNVYSKDYIDGKLLAIDNELAALKEFAASMPGQLEEIYQAIEATQEFLTQALNAHAADIEDLQGQVDTLQEAIDTIIAKLDKQVTGILIQGVYSPVFGNFRTPLGVKSNILFNWYGYNERNLAIEFPSNDVNVNGKPGLDFAALAPAGKFTAPQGYYADDEEGNVTLGKVYVTLNPVGAQIENLQVTLEKSNGDALPYPVTLTPSDYVLQNGYTRTAENGFYEGEVKMPLNEDNLNDIVVALEEDLKVAMKDVVKDPSKTTAKALVKAVLEQLQGKIPAYGLRYGWNNGLADETDPGFAVGNYAAVLSQYDLAVATALPLGYNFAKGYPGSSVKLPEIGHIENLINKIKENGALKFELSDITVGEFTINWDEINFNETGNGQLTITIPNVMMGEDLATAEPVTLILTTDKTVVAKQGEIVSYIEGLDDIKSGIVSGIESGVQDLTGQLTSQIKSQLDDVIDQINKQLGGQIDKMFDGILEPFEPYYGKIDKAIDLYNKIANKINNFLKDPNAYLQVAAFYSMGGSSDYGIASGKKNDPTPFYSKGGDSFKIFLSSYTGELIVPACKKYVAVTGVYKNGAPVANVDLASLNTGNLNKVLSGNQIEVLVKGLPAGNVYEFTYQALDYRGYTSTKKFYIEVK